MKVVRCPAPHTLPTHLSLTSILTNHWTKYNIWHIISLFLVLVLSPPHSLHYESTLISHRSVTILKAMYQKLVSKVCLCVYISFYTNYYYLSVLFSICMWISNMCFLFVYIILAMHIVDTHFKDSFHHSKHGNYQPITWDSGPRLSCALILPDNS